MSLSIRKEIEISALELQKLTTFSKKIGLTTRHIKNLVKILDKLELMILDSSFKDMDLVKLQSTILILPQDYLYMLQNVTVRLLLELKSFIKKN